jgi:hypothetical protein
VTTGGRRLRRIVAKHRGEIEGLMLRRWPAFVLGDVRPGADAEIPVFAFHQEPAETLTPMLEYLAANQYRTLTADEYLERRGRTRGAEREVLLTFDDGHVGLYRGAFPALRRLGQKAVAYVVPGRIPEPEAGEPDAGEPEAGAVGGDGGRELCDWGELAAMHASGVIDVQSHAWLHHSVAISDRIVEFARPDRPLSFMASDLAPVDAARAAGPPPVPSPAAGTPIHVWGPRYGARPAWLESADLERACVEEARRPGEELFARRDWKERLRAVATAARRRGARGRYEDVAEQSEAIRDDAARARAAIEARLPGKTVRHFCYPWYQGSPLAARLLREAGMLTHAWGSVPPRFASGADMPLPVRRLPPELLWRLPGEGRRPLRQIMIRRWTRTLSGAGQHG